MPSYLTGGYVPPGVFTQTIFQPTTPPLFNGLRIPIYIGVGQEQLTQSNYELVRGSSAIVDTQVFNEDVSNSFIVSDANPAAPVLGPSGGTLTIFQVQNYPITDGSGHGIVTTNPLNVSVTISSPPGSPATPVSVVQVAGATGQVTLADPPPLGAQVLCTYFFKRTDTKITDNVSAQANGTATTFQVNEFPITDGTNGGITTTDPSTVVVKVNGTQVVPTAVDGTNGLVTLPSAPAAGATVLITHYFNTWQNTFDYLPNSDIVTIGNCGLTPNRSDFFQGPDFNVFGSDIHWGASDTINAGIVNTGTTPFNSSQVSVTLVDNNIYLEKATPYVNTSVTPAVTSRIQFLLNHIPTLGNGLNTPLGSSLYNQLANGRIDVTSDRPDLVTVFVGQSVQDAISRPPVTVASVNGAERLVTLAQQIPLNTNVYCSYYYSNLADDVYTLTCITPQATGGQYSVSSGIQGQLYGLVYNDTGTAITKTSLPQTLGWPSNIEQQPDVIHYGGTPVAETVTVTMTQLAAIGATLTNAVAGPWVITSSNQTLDFAYTAPAVSPVSVTLPLSTAPVIQGVNAGPFTFNAGETLTVVVNGGAKQVFTLTGSALSAATVAANITAQNPQGFTATAGGVGSNYLVLTGTQLGATSTLQVPSASVTLGFLSAAVVTGADTTATQVVEAINAAAGDTTYTNENQFTGTGATNFTGGGGGAGHVLHVPVAPNTVTVKSADSVVVQGITYSAVAPGPNSGITVAYVSGGSLSVAVVGSAITVTIVPGTSTNTLIQGAVAGYAPASALVNSVVNAGQGAVTPTVQTATALTGGTTATDDGAGTIAGTGLASGSINYTTGVLDLNYITAPGNGAVINATYTAGISTVAALVQNSVTSESVGTGNGINATFTYTVSNTPVVINSVTLTAGSVTGTDNGLGSISGAGISSGSINYETGAVSVTFSTIPANNTAITIAYKYVSSSNFTISTGNLATPVIGPTAFVTITGGTSLATLGFEANETDSGSPVTAGFTVSSSNVTAGSSGTGLVGQTYTDAKTGLRFSLLASPSGGSYNLGGSFQFTIGTTLTTNASLPSLVIPGAQTTVTSLANVGVNNTSVINTYAPSGNAPAVGDFYYLTYTYEKTDFTPAVYSKFSDILSDFGPLSPTNSLTLAAYLAIQNGAVAVALSQVMKVPGTNQASDQAYITAIDALSTPLTDGTRPAVIVPLTTSPTVVTFLGQNVQIQSSIRYQNERIAMFGFAAGTTPIVAQQTAQSLANNRMIAIYPDSVIIQLVDQFGNPNDAVLDGSFLAAAVSGSNVAPAFDVATPMTNRSIVGFKALGRILDMVDQNQTAAAGVTVLADLSPNIIVRQFLTTDMSNSLTREPTVTTISDFVQISVRNALRQFIGVKFLPSILQDIERVVANTLKTLQTSQIISQYTGVSASVDPSDPTSALVEAFYAPIFPLNYIVVTFTLQSTIG